MDSLKLDLSHPDIGLERIFLEGSLAIGFPPLLKPASLFCAMGCPENITHVLEIDLFASICSPLGDCAKTLNQALTKSFNVAHSQAIEARWWGDKAVIVTAYSFEPWPSLGARSAIAWNLTIGASTMLGLAGFWEQVFSKEELRYIFDMRTFLASQGENEILRDFWIRNRAEARWRICASYALALPGEMIPDCIEPSELPLQGEPPPAARAAVERWRRGCKEGPGLRRPRSLTPILDRLGRNVPLSLLVRPAPPAWVAAAQLAQSLIIEAAHPLNLPDFSLLDFP